MRRLVGLLTLIALLALAESALAKIVPNRSIAGAKLGMSEDRVEDVLGKPSDRFTSDNETGANDVFLTYPMLKVDLTFEDARIQATEIRTTRTSERTAGGLGVGSTRAQVKAGLEGERCSSASCQIGSKKDGGRQTVFSFKRGRVNEVTVSRNPGSR